MGRIVEFLGMEANEEYLRTPPEFRLGGKPAQKEQENYFWRSGSRVQAKDVNGPNTFKVRKAKVGGYRDYFDDDQVAELDAMVDSRLLPVSATPPPESKEATRWTSAYSFIQMSASGWVRWWRSTPSAAIRQPDQFDVRFIHTRDYPLPGGAGGQTFLRGGTTGSGIWTTCNPSPVALPAAGADELAGRAVVTDPTCSPLAISTSCWTGHGWCGGNGSSSFRQIRKGLPGGDQRDAAGLRQTAALGCRKTVRPVVPLREGLQGVDGAGL